MESPEGTSKKRMRRTSDILQNGPFHPLSEDRGRKAPTPSNKIPLSPEQTAGTHPGSSSAVAQQARVAEQVRVVGPMISSEEIRTCLRHYNDYHRESQALKERRPDLKALSKMKRLGLTLKHNTTKIGEIPGVNVGAQFFARCELAAIGLHKYWLNGISFIPGKKGQPSICSSLVMSGGYEDDEDEGANVTYTGSGGNNLTSNRKQGKDQELKLGNLALKNNVASGHPVRLIRGHQSKNSYTGTVYTYDGLYKVIDCLTKKGKSNYTIYKFVLERLPGQAALTTEQVRFCKGLVGTKDIKALEGLVVEDISGGQEAVPILASNNVDDPPVPPSGFEYTNKNVLPPGFEPPPPPSSGCSCKGKCYDNGLSSPQNKCACAKRNGGSIPYTEEYHGRLVKARNAIFECGPKCQCGPDCPNRTVQRGIRFKFEVYKTADKGWAVRSWDSIPSGAPICEYTGDILTSEDADNLKEQDEYIFDLDAVKTSRGVDGRQPRSGDILGKSHTEGDVDTEHEVPHEEFSINAMHKGNVARFINHSCAPNLFVQPVFYDHDDVRFPHIWLFARDNIVPLTELTYDYGYVEGSVVIDGVERKKPCFCNADTCSGRMY